MPTQMDASRNGIWFYIKNIEDFSLCLGLRMASPGARMPSTPIGHHGPGGPMPSPYRPQGMSPSMNQPGSRMHITNSPGVNSISLKRSVSYLVKIN